MRAFDVIFYLRPYIIPIYVYARWACGLRGISIVRRRGDTFVRSWSRDIISHGRIHSYTYTTAIICKYVYKICARRLWPRSKNVSFRCLSFWRRACERSPAAAIRTEEKIAIFSPSKHTRTRIRCIGLSEECTRAVEFAYIYIYTIT